MNNETKYDFHEKPGRFSFPGEWHWAKLNKPLPWWREPAVWGFATVVVIVATLMILVVRTP